MATTGEIQPEEVPLGFVDGYMYLGLVSREFVSEGWKMSRRLYECWECGAVVGNPEGHSHWHSSLRAPQ